MEPRKVAIAVDREVTVSALLDRPKDARACLVLAHGAGAGMTHPFMAAIAAGLGERGIATLRYNFPYMERRSPRPDSPKVATATVRAAHLDKVAVPLLFLQGSKDAFAELDLLQPMTARLGERATLTLFDSADHSFHVAAKTGKRDADIRRELIDSAATWMLALL